MDTSDGSPASTEGKKGEKRVRPSNEAWRSADHLKVAESAPLEFPWNRSDSILANLVPEPLQPQYLEHADRLARTHPVLVTVYEVAEIGRGMLKQAEHRRCNYPEDRNVWSHKNLFDPSDGEALARLRKAADRFAKLPDSELGKWLTELFKSCDVMQPCTECGCYRNPEHLDNVDGKLYCNLDLTVQSLSGHSSEGFQEVAYNCAKTVHQNITSADWLEQTKCPICQSVLGQDCEVTRNISDEVISAVCPRCRIQLYRPASEVDSTTPAELHRALTRGSSYVRPPIFA